VERGGCCFDGHLGHRQSDGSGGIKQFDGGEPEFGAPHGGVDDKNEPFAGHIRQTAMGSQGGRETGAKLLFKGVEPEGTTHRVGGSIRQRGL
jgi:hypothetical protein